LILVYLCSIASTLESSAVFIRLAECCLVVLECDCNVWPCVYNPHGPSVDPHSFSDLDFAELLELLVPALETLASEAASLGLELKWQKTKVQALGINNYSSRSGGCNG